MQKPAFPTNETDRLQALSALDILDTPPEERFDRITRIAQRHFGLVITLISLIDNDRQWFKSRQGLEACETSRDISFCGHAILANRIFCVPDTHRDARFADNPLVTGAPHIRFYAGAPLTTSGGQRIGTLCIIYSQPRELSSEDAQVLLDLAACVESELQYTRLLAAASESARLAVVVERTDNAVIITDARGVTEWVNQGFERITGYTLAEAIGKRPGALLQGPDTDPSTIAFMNQNIRDGEGFKTEVLNYHKNGSTYWLTLNVQPVYDKQDQLIQFIAVESDITDRKTMEADLRASENRIRSILETVVDGIVTIDAQGFIQTFNPAAERIFGYSADQIIGRRVHMLMPDAQHRDLDSYLTKYVAAGDDASSTMSREATGLRKNGSTFPMELAVSGMAINGRRMFTGIVRDISERKKVDRLKSEFVTTISHELRTPLTSIRGALGLVLGTASEGLTDTVRDLLVTANRNCERLTVLINDILDLEKLESGSLEFSFTRLDLVELTARALIANQAYADQHQVQLQFFEHPSQARIRGDESRLFQVFFNLLSNAVKYSAQNGMVEVSVIEKNGGFRVKVRDHGRGIPEAFRDRIFQRFAQADSSDSCEKVGTGLGLSITKTIVERHGGTIGYTSEEEAGSEFFFDLPAWQEEAPSSSDALALE